MLSRFNQECHELPGGFQTPQIADFGSDHCGAQKLNAAKRPLLYVGGGVNLSNSAEELTALARKARLPVTTTLLGDVDARWMDGLAGVILCHAEPVSRQYQDESGEWCNFVNANHEHNMVKSNQYKIRNLYTVKEEGK